MWRLRQSIPFEGFRTWLDSGDGRAWLQAIRWLRMDHRRRARDSQLKPRADHRFGGEHPECSGRRIFQRGRLPPVPGVAVHPQLAVARLRRSQQSMQLTLSEDPHPTEVLRPAVRNEMSICPPGFNTRASALTAARSSRWGWGRRLPARRRWSCPYRRARGPRST